MSGIVVDVARVVKERQRRTRGDGNYLYTCVFYIVDKK